MSCQPFRRLEGGLIDRTQTLSFRFDGRIYTGFWGDTLASALLANGVRLVGRSFKYHRPRGFIGAGVEESNALVQLGEAARSTPNVRATEIPLYDGLVAAASNCWPNVRFDVGAINDRLSRFLSAGFYYKTFMWPSWRLYEGFIRRAAGIGKVAEEADPDQYVHRFAHCDVLVVGAGAAGLAAARAASSDGARIILVEQDSRTGGGLLWNDAQIEGRSGVDWAIDTEAVLRKRPETIVLTRTTAVGYYDHNAVTLVEQVGDEVECASRTGLPRFRLWQVRARKVILATGAIERPLVFAGNDAPGVMLSSAVRHYVKRFAVLPGERAILFTNNDDAYATALALDEAGAEIAAIVDLRSSVPDALICSARLRDIPVHVGAVVIGTSGRKQLRRVRVRLADGSRRDIHCDLLAMSGGWNPTVHLFSQSGGSLSFDPDLACFRPDHSVQDEQSVGMAAGTFGLEAALREGHRAGLRSAGLAEAVEEAPACALETAAGKIQPSWRVEGGRGKAFVDFQNDVTVDDIDLAARESFRSVEHLKRYTTLGMASDQGKTSNVNALAIMASLTGRSITDTGGTRYRPPYTPQPLGVYAGSARGDLFRPIRHVPAHDRHLALGGLAEDYGGWIRFSHYPRPGENDHACEQREALAVRTAAGLFDGSTLGKIEVKGADAGRFLDLVYANTMSTLKQGYVRYGLMLGEDGVVIDDGVTARIAPDHFLVATSSGGAARVAAWMDEWLQCEWPDLDVVVLPVTSSWSVATLTGPLAREILNALGSDIDLSPEGFPHMRLRIGHIGGISARIFRVSYTGEISFEINVPASRGAELWDRLMAAGVPYGLTPVGIEAWLLLRAEKGYLHVGVDTDGTTSAIDVGWGHVLKKSQDFIGKRSLVRSHDRDERRLQFVGFEALDGKRALPLGAHVVEQRPSGTQSGGYVSSSVFSPTLKRGVALGMLAGGRRRLGEEVLLRDGNRDHRARVVSPVFYDPQNERLDG